MNWFLVAFRKRAQTPNSRKLETDDRVSEALILGFGTSAFRRNRWVGWEVVGIASFFSGESTPQQASFGQARGQTSQIPIFVFRLFAQQKVNKLWDTGNKAQKVAVFLPVATYILLCCPFLVLVNHSFTVFSSSRLMARWCKQTCWGAALAKLYPCHAWEPVLYCLVAHCPCCIHLAELVRWPGQS